MKFDEGQLDPQTPQPKEEPPEPQHDPDDDSYVLVRVPHKMMVLVEQLIELGLFGTTPVEVIERMAAEAMRRFLPGS